MTAKELYSELTTWNVKRMLANAIIGNVPFDEYIEELIKFKFRDGELPDNLVKRVVKNMIKEVKRR